jgi:hypothetical protein
MITTVCHITSDSGQKISSYLIFVEESASESSSRGFKIRVGKITMPLAESDVKIKLL